MGRLAVLGFIRRDVQRREPVLFGEESSCVGRARRRRRRHGRREERHDEMWETDKTASSAAQRWSQPHVPLYICLSLWLCIHYQTRTMQVE